MVVDEPSIERSSRRKSRVSGIFHESLLGVLLLSSRRKGRFESHGLHLKLDNEPCSTKEADSRISQIIADEDIVMVDAGGPTEATPLPAMKRSSSSAKKAGIGGMLGGFLSKGRPDGMKRRSTQNEDEDRLRREERKMKRSRDAGNLDADAEVHEDDEQEARRAARRARKAERDAADQANEAAAEDARRAKDAERRDRRKRQEEAEEVRRHEDKEARRTARREARAADEADRIAEEERVERRRVRRAERDALAARADELAAASERRVKSERRRSYMDAATTDDDRRDRRRQRANDFPRTSRRKSAGPDINDYFDPRNSSKHHDDGEKYVYEDSSKHKYKMRPGWPHSGTDSWVKEHSDAPPPPDDTNDNSPVVPTTEDTEADEEARRRLRRSRKGQSRYDDPTAEDADRRRRREQRRAEREAAKSTRSSSHGRASKRDSGFVENILPRASTGGWWSKIKGGS